MNDLETITQVKATTNLFWNDFCPFGAGEGSIEVRAWAVRTPAIVEE